jgi:hypothetical protein
MAQQTTTIPTKTAEPPNNTIHDKVSEVNELVTVIDDNAQDLQDRAIVLENTNVSDIPSYSTASLPTSGPNLTTGKLAYNTDLEVPIYFDEGLWRKLSDNLVVLDYSDVDVFIVLGQSNAHGYSFWTDLGTAEKNVDRENNLMYHATLDVDLVTWLPGTWGQIDPPNNTGWQWPDTFGPEVGFSDTIKNLVDTGSSSTFTKPIAMAKFAKGGTNLADDWDPLGLSNYMYDGWISTLNDFKTKLTNGGYTYNIRGVIWFQGEADAANSTNANAYEANLTAFIAQLRSDVGSPNLPFVISKIKYTTDPGFEAVVRTAQQNVADNLQYVSILDAANYTRKDNVHLDSDSMYQYGVDAVSAMEQAILGNE